MDKLGIDDKDLGIIAILIIACWSLTTLGLDAKEIVVPCVTGICGFVVGKKKSE